MMRRRFILWGAVWVAGAVLLLGASAITYLAATEWAYIERIRHHPRNSILDVGWYEPKASVAGGDGAALPSARAAEAGIDPAALIEVAKIAETKNTSALLIVHCGRVVLEQHWHGHQTGTWTNSASMAKTITALLLGVALDEGKIRSLEEPAATWLPAWRDGARRRSHFATCSRCIPACGPWAITTTLSQTHVISR
jgi:CubicO group peptidase (beta-lactamase class C family)